MNKRTSGSHLLPLTVLALGVGVAAPSASTSMTAPPVESPNVSFDSVGRVHVEDEGLLSWLNEGIGGDSQLWDRAAGPSPTPTGGNKLNSLCSCRTAGSAGK